MAKYYNNYQQQNQKRYSADDLISEIDYFVRHNKLTPHDWVILTELIKQIKKMNSTFPRKVYNSIQSKFESIKSNYQGR